MTVFLSFITSLSIATASANPVSTSGSETTGSCSDTSGSGSDTSGAETSGSETGSETAGSETGVSVEVGVPEEVPPPPQLTATVSAKSEAAKVNNFFDFFIFTLLFA